MKVNLAKKFEELKKIQTLMKDARKLVERELGKKILEAYLQGKGAQEIYRLAEHLIKEVYAYDKIYRMQLEKTEKARIAKSRKNAINTHEEVRNDEQRENT